MKKTLRNDKKPRLAVRTEHIRTLTPQELERVAGGDRPTGSDGCHSLTYNAQDTCQ